MESRKMMHKHSRSSRTSSRVNDKIREYCTKFGKDRDLEKFLRLYSPASSRSTTTTTTSVSDDDGAMRRLFRETTEEFRRATSNIELIAESDSSREGVRAKEFVIPISIEEPKQEHMASGSGGEDLQTPKKPQNSVTKQTQTPDSISKSSHKRLEWDSLGDVGYKKSMSTSNISILERSLLKEFFQETTSVAATKLSTNASEGDLKQLQKELLQEFTLTSNKSHSRKNNNNNTPPLASSTFVDVKSSAKTIHPTGTRPKFTTQGTSTSLQQKFEKYAQTSIQRAGLTSQEVQVDMSSVAPSTMCSSATPTSFEYYSSRSSRNSTATSNDDRVTNSKSSRRRPQTTQPVESQQQHPFVAGITEMLLSRRKVLADKNHQSNYQSHESADLKQIHDTLKRALSEDKENESSVSFVRSPQLDLGIQLLCSLIDAKSLNHKQKKQLVRDIVKSISRLSGAASDASTMSSSESHAKETTKSDALEKLVYTNVYKQPSAPKTTSTRATNKATTKVPTTNRDTQTEAEMKGTSQTKSTNSVPKEAAAIVKAKTEPVEIDTESRIKNSHEIPTTPKAQQQIRTRSTDNSTATSVVTSVSDDLTTQKATNAANNCNTDSEQATMREWLNPMTQSEIEYEEKKRELAKIAAKREKLIQKTKTSKPVTERFVQLNWIETEIQRLESLRYLLLGEDEGSSSAATTTATTTTISTKSHSAQQRKGSEKLYDTVCSSDKSSPEPLVQEIEVIIEESSEDVINLADNLKRSKERKRETQIVYDKPSAGQILAQGNARFRSVKETITTNEAQILPIVIEENKKPDQQQQQPRSKIDTPSGSNDSESVCSFVQQRKREFMEHYKNKKKNHYEALLHQQKEQEQQQLLRQQFQKRPSTSVAAAVAATQTVSGGHYSVPHTMHRAQTMQHLNQPEYYQPPHQPCYDNQLQPPPPRPHHVKQYSLTVSAGLTSGNNTDHHHANSSSSMFCISSEVSIPMGSNATSSTPTTTHQYDDVAGVGVQTSDSMLRSKPIYGPRYARPAGKTDKNWCGSNYIAASSQTACVQVKPKAIAYVISFGDNKTETSSGTTTAIGGSDEQPPTLTLQDHFQRAKPKFCAQSKQRKVIVNQLQALRQERERELHEIVENTSMYSLDRKLQRLPPPPTRHIRMFNTREMKARTNKRCAQLPEVLEKKERDREERRRRGNRIIRDVFNRRLQKRVRNGQLSLNYSRTVI